MKILNHVKKGIVMPLYILDDFIDCSYMHLSFFCTLVGISFNFNPLSSECILEDLH